MSMETAATTTKAPLWERINFRAIVFAGPNQVKQKDHSRAIVMSVDGSGNVTEKPVDVAVTVPKTGEVGFACGMDMFHGVVVAQPST